MRRKRRSPAFAGEEPENTALHLGSEALKIVSLLANMMMSKITMVMAMIMTVVVIMRTASMMKMFYTWEEKAPPPPPPAGKKVVGKEEARQQLFTIRPIGASICSNELKLINVLPAPPLFISGLT